MNKEITLRVRDELSASGIGPELFDHDRFDIRIDRKDLASLIDHTILKAEATVDAVRKVCMEAKECGFASVCVNSGNIPLVVAELKGSNVKPISVVGFPLGAMKTEAKVFEAREAIGDGAEEIDMVMNIGLLKSKKYKDVFSDIEAVVNASVPHPVKVIIETSLLTRDEKIAACLISKAAGAAYVKTSTGFGPGGAAVEDVILMREAVGPKMGVKASGGIRSKEDMLRMIDAGATRIGTSSGVSIIKGGISSVNY